VALAPNGPGSVDVVELDAASHGGVDDTRELRDRAFYAPAQSRYRIFIVDEAHMVTTAGFNALLKIVEEPPDHLIFVFATTEPEKVLPTIRSRTHHYPFRLLAPAHDAVACWNGSASRRRGGRRDGLSVGDPRGRRPRPRDTPFGARPVARGRGR
jgi:replication-associated recombination protein RarA